jgi:DNA-binding CsgD family transcriptional regulator
MVISISSILFHAEWRSLAGTKEKFTKRRRGTEKTFHLCLYLRHLRQIKYDWPQMAQHFRRWVEIQFASEDPRTIRRKWLFELQTIPSQVCATSWPNGSSAQSAWSTSVFQSRGVQRAADYTGAASLSKREQEVLRLLSQGFTNQAISETLDVSPKTIATYRARIGEKLGLKTTAEFVKYADDLGIPKKQA